jgi:hypothetical protein
MVGSIVAPESSKESIFETHTRLACLLVSETVWESLLPMKRLFVFAKHMLPQGLCHLNQMIGQGSMGRVYGVRQFNLDRSVASKILHRGHGSDYSFLAFCA